MWVRGETEVPIRKKACGLQSGENLAGPLVAQFRPA
jgi:hypothetical protein